MAYASVEVEIINVFVDKVEQGRVVVVMDPLIIERVSGGRLGWSVTAPQGLQPLGTGSGSN